jgi:integrase
MSTIMTDTTTRLTRSPVHVPWNKGRLIGQRPPLKVREVWAVRSRLQQRRSARDLALFNLAVDSKLRGCDLVSLRVDDVCTGGRLRTRTMVRQKKTGHPVQFELTDQCRDSVAAWIAEARLRESDWLFPSRKDRTKHLTARQYARLVHRWIAEVGLETSRYGTHSLRRTKATLIYRKTGNLRAVQILLGHTKIESTVRYLGVEVDDALAIAEHVDL